LAIDKVVSKVAQKYHEKYYTVDKN